MDFPCTKCGACCRRVRCEMLCDNLCMVYDKRPLICNIDDAVSLLYPDKDINEYYRESAIACNIMIKEDRMDKKYLIDIKWII